MNADMPKRDMRIKGDISIYNEGYDKGWEDCHDRWQLYHLRKMPERVDVEKLRELIYRFYITKCEPLLKEMDEIENKILSFNPPQETATEIAQLSRSDKIKGKILEISDDLVQAIAKEINK